MTDAKCKQSTPHGTLLEQIMDSGQPKNEREWAASREIESLRQQLAESDTNTLRLIETIKYLVGIAERGEERKQLDDETAEQFVLGYMKRIEQQLAECQAREKILRDVINRQPYTMDKSICEVLAMPSDSTALDEAIKQAKREALIEAISACSNETVEIIDFSTDTAYNLAITHCIAELRRRAEELK